MPSRTSSTGVYRRTVSSSPFRCQRCARTSFPPRASCPSCRNPLTRIELPDRGRLYAFTTQETVLRFRTLEVLALAEVGGVVVPGIALAPYSELQIGRRSRSSPVRSQRPD